MNVKSVIWVAFVILLLIVVVKWENSKPLDEVVVEPEEVAVVTGEIVAN